VSAHTCHFPPCPPSWCPICGSCEACHALFGRLAPALPSPVPQADEWTPTADDPRRCPRCQSAPCGCHGTDAAQARASLPDAVVLGVWVKR
jgi:hypothetical protein